MNPCRFRVAYPVNLLTGELPTLGVWQKLTGSNWPNGNMETSRNSVRHAYRWEPGNKRLVQLGSKVRTRCRIFHLRWLHHMVSWSFWQVSHRIVDFLRRPCGADPRIAVRWSPWALCQRTLPIWTWRRAWKWIWLYQVEVHHVARVVPNKTKFGKIICKGLGLCRWSAEEPTAEGGAFRPSTYCFHSALGCFACGHWWWLSWAEWAGHWEVGFLLHMILSLFSNA